jgi:hypothetical protein
VMPIHIVNRVLECWNGSANEKPLTSVSHIIVHRIEPELGETAVELAKQFQDERPFQPGSYTGGLMPYHIVVFKDGHAEQAVELENTAPHARWWSRHAYGVAVSGDFHLNDTPTEVQWRTLVGVCAGLAYWMGVYTLCGHTESQYLPGHPYTRDPLKNCPGHGLPMDNLRLEVQEALKNTAYLEKQAKELVMKHWGFVLKRSDSASV